MRADFWHQVPDGRIQCDVCPRHCRLREGQSGFCQVRRREGGALWLDAFGQATGFCVDPIEKKPLNHFLPGTSILSFGTVGCNLACKFCQNWRMTKSKANFSSTAMASPAAIADLARQLGCRSVAFTYNDPVIYCEYAVAVARALRPLGIKTVAVTAGYIDPEPRAVFFDHMDAANVDLKSFSDAFYRRYCGGRLAPVLETLVYLVQHTKVWLELTTLLIPGENDSEAELEALCQWVVSHLGPTVPIHFSAFHPDWKMLDKPRTAVGTLAMARRIALRNGLRYPFTGNVLDREGGSTWCHGCGRVVIDRAGWEIKGWHLLDGGLCRGCRTPCAGVFDVVPGQWGNRRVPVRLV